MKLFISILFMVLLMMGYLWAVDNCRMLCLAFWVITPLTATGLLYWNERN